MPFHQRKQRWACLVAHRRAGKTVAAVNDEIKRALEVKAPYAYIAPFRAQAKAVAWEYFKYYAGELKRRVNEAELTIDLINGSSIRLFGVDNADAMRGLGFGGAYCDEYGDFRPSVWGNVIRPTLTERKGWAVFAGTPKGHNQFYDVFRLAEQDKEWFALTLKASVSKLIPEDELRAIQQQLSEDQYNQEYECSFDAAIVGAYYGREMAAVENLGRITKVELDPAVAVQTAWDLGYTDDTAIWFYQNVKDEVHILDYYAVSGASIEDICKEVLDRPYIYRRHWLPHDARAKTLASGGKSIVEQLAVHLGLSRLAIVPNIGVEQGIQAVRRTLGHCWFDRVKTMEGIEALRQYQREYDEDKKVFRKTHLHNWCSHGADAMRMLAVAERRHEETESERVKAATIYEMTLDELWAHHEEQLMERKRI